MTTTSASPATPIYVTISGEPYRVVSVFSLPERDSMGHPIRDRAGVSLIRVTKRGRKDFANGSGIPWAALSTVRVALPSEDLSAFDQLVRQVSPTVESTTSPALPIALSTDSAWTYRDTSGKAVVAYPVTEGMTLCVAGKTGRVDALHVREDGQTFVQTEVDGRPVLSGKTELTRRVAATVASLDPYARPVDELSCTLCGGVADRIVTHVVTIARLTLRSAKVHTLCAVCFGKTHTQPHVIGYYPVGLPGAGDSNAAHAALRGEKATQRYSVQLDTSQPCGLHHVVRDSLTGEVAVGQAYGYRQHAELQAAQLNARGRVYTRAEMARVERAIFVAPELANPLLINRANGRVFELKSRYDDNGLKLAWVRDVLTGHRTQVREDMIAGLFDELSPLS